MVRSQSEATARRRSPRAGARRAPGGHRERLIAAMAASIEQKGYRETSVADVVRIARTSRRSYYEHFADRDACFLALFDAANDATMRRIAAAVRPDHPWERQVDEAIGAYLDSVSERLELFRSFARELPALGRAGAARQSAVIERFARLLVALVESGRRRQPRLRARPLTLDMATIIVGGLRELTVIALERGREVEELRAGAREGVKAILGATVAARQESAGAKP